jgi:SAM-dependent methyltransferase
MNRSIRTSVRLFAQTFQPAGPVVEVGSLYPPGFEALCNLRPFFDGREYIGCDIRPGLGVDRREDAQALSFADKSVGTVLLFEILEHLPNPHRAVAEAWRVLREDGLLGVSVPFNYRLHGFPSDYWRFTSSGVYTLLSDFADKIVFAAGPKVKPTFIFAVAAKQSTPVFADKKSRFEAAIHETFRRSRLSGHLSVLKERSRDLLGYVLGRAGLSVAFFDPHQPGGYTEAAHEVRSDRGQAGV